MGVKITENFIKEFEALRRCLLFKNVTWEIEKKDEYDDWGGQTHPDNSFNIHLVEMDKATSSCFGWTRAFGEKGHNIDLMEHRKWEEEQWKYIADKHPEVDLEDDELDWDPYISDTMNAELKMKALYSAYLDVAEWVVEYIREQFELEDQIVSVYAGNNLLIQSTTDNDEGKIDAFRFFRRVKIMLTYRCMESIKSARSAYVAFAGKNEKLYGNMDELVLLGKLQILEEDLLPENAKMCDITNNDGVNTLSVDWGYIVWDYTQNEYKEIEK